MTTSAPPTARQFSVRGLLTSILTVCVVLAAGRAMGAGASVLQLASLLALFASISLSGLTLLPWRVGMGLWIFGQFLACSVFFLATWSGAPWWLAASITCLPYAASGGAQWVFRVAHPQYPAVRWGLLIAFCSVALTDSSPISSAIFQGVAFLLQLGLACLSVSPSAMRFRRLLLPVLGASAATIIYIIPSVTAVMPVPAMVLAVACLLPLIGFAWIPLAPPTGEKLLAQDGDA